jgi:hypothetical protein
MRGMAIPQGAVFNRGLYDDFVASTEEAFTGLPFITKSGVSSNRFPQDG